MKRTRPALAAAAVLATLLAPALVVADESALATRISLDLKQASAQEVLLSFAGILHARLDLAPQVDGKVSVHLDNVTVATALSAVCESRGLRWSVGGGVLRIDLDRPATPAPAASLDQPVDLSLVDATAATVLATFARILGVPIDLDPALADGRVTIDLKQQPVSKSLDAVCARLGCRWKLVAGERPILSVTKG